MYVVLVFYYVIVVADDVFVVYAVPLTIASVVSAVFMMLMLPRVLLVMLSL